MALLIGIVAVTLFNPIASTMQASYEKLENRILRMTGDPISLSNAGLWLRQSDARRRTDHCCTARSCRRRDLPLRNVGLFFINRPLAIHRRASRRNRRGSTAAFG